MKRIKKWQKIVLWSLAGMVVLLFVAVATLMLLLAHNEGFRRDILGKVESSIEESTGGRLEVGDFKFRLSNLTLDIYNIVLHGREADASKPLLTADHLQVGLTIDSLLHRKWHVRDIVLDHPVVRLQVNQEGENNLPQPQKKSASSSNTNIFDLAIRELKLDRGEIYYNDQKTPLDAELRDFALTANYDPAQNKYAGQLGYDDGRIIYGKYAPVEHNFQAHFGITPQTFTLDKLELAAGKSHVVVSATVNDYSSPNRKAEGRYEAELVTGELQRILKDPSIPAGTVKLDGQLSYQGDPNRPMLETVAVNGNVSSSGLAVKTPSLQTQVRDIYARYTLAHGNAEVRDIRAHILGGVLSGKLTIRDVSGAGVARLQASLKDLSLDQAQAAMHKNPAQQAHLSGKLNADADARWARTLDNLTAHSDLTMQGRVGQGEAMPLDGVIHADYAAARKQVAFRNSYVRTPRSTLTMNGEVSNRCQLQVALRSNDLHEIEQLMAALTKPSPGQPQQQLGLYGTETANASVTGPLNAPQVNGQLEARNFRVKGSSWKVLRTGFSANPSLASVSNGDLEALPKGQIKFSAQAGLKNWAFTPSSPIAAKVSASQISLTDLERLLDKTYPVSGTLALNVSLRGSQLNPVGQGTLTVTNGKVSSENIQNVNVKFQGNGNAINADMTVKVPAGTAHASVDYMPKTQGYRARVTAENFRLEKLQTVKQRDAQIAGGLNLNVSGQGTIKDPQLQAVLEIPQLQIKNQTMQGLRLETTVQNQVAMINLNSDVAKIQVKAHGTVGIQSPYQADVRLDTSRIDFQPIVAMFAPAQANDLSGQTELHATLRGPLAEKSRVEAHVEVPTLALNYKKFQLAAAKPIHVDYQNGTATLQPTAIRGTGTAIDAQASVPVTTPKAATFLVQGNVDLQVAQLFVPDLKSTGQLQFDLDSKRYGPGANMNGQIRIVQANLHTLDSPVGLDNANGVINVTQTRLEIANFEGQVGGGTLNATGAVAYRPSIQFELGLKANNIRIRYPDGMREVLASDLALRGTTQESLLRGVVKIEHVSFTPDFDMGTFTSQFSDASSDTGTPGSFTQGMKLDIAVQSTSEMNLSSSTVSLRGDANLRVVGTAAAPVILGRTNIAGGEVFVQNNRYQLQQGTIDFVNPVRTEPVLNLHVTATIQQYNITLGLLGPLSRLETTYVSDPPLPPVDVINLIATGKTVESGAANPSPSRVLGAESLLASTVSGEVTGRVAKLAGVSQLQIDPSLGTDNGQNPGARVAIQQRVTSNLFVTYATDITSTQRQAVQIEYKFNPRWSVSGNRNQNGGFGVDGKYRKDF